MSVTIGTGEGGGGRCRGVGVGGSTPGLMVCSAGIERQPPVGACAARPRLAAHV